MTRLFLISLNILFLSVHLFAQESISVALANMSMNYTESDDSGNFLDSEKSNGLSGFEVSYTNERPSMIEKREKIVFNFSSFSGQTDYDGFYISTGEAVQSKTFNRMYDVGCDYTQGVYVDIFDLRYGVGAGYHQWYRELSVYQNETYYWFYLTPIIEVSSKISDVLQIGISGKYKYTINPIMEANTIDEQFKLGYTDSLELSVQLDYSINENIELFAQGTTLRQKIGKSNYVSGYIDGVYYTTIHEPKSTDYRNYIKVGVRYKY